MYKLPQKDSPLRQLFNMEELVDMLAYPNWKSVQSVRDALYKARALMQSDSAIREIHSVATESDGTIVLLRAGCHGGVRRLWRFGNPAKELPRA